MTDDAIVGWRYQRPGFQWAFARTEPTAKSGEAATKIEPVYSAAEIARLRAALEKGRSLGHREAIFAALKARERAEEAHEARLKAEAERDAARAHNADLSATLEARVQAARAKAMEDAAKVAHAELHFDGELANEVAAAIRAMIQTPEENK